ncbi:MAG: hypothetical protein JRI96_09990 [Deltaproteobacteria bacterium]|nr:hypothetical protein [Deltaproteobacteria bacterium]MBW1936253.1 hypothetical protein [Deltaproteobacteria bacterium]MBW2045195.1 hypothetical protein [Deltaproteobacteria bacterium]
MSATDNDRAMILASFVADSLALGAHWIYDTALIEKQFGRVDNLMKPRSQSYHEGGAPRASPWHHLVSPNCFAIGGT